MTPQEVGTKLDDYAQKIRDAYDKENFDEALIHVKEYNIFLDGLLGGELDQQNRDWYYTLRVSVSLMRRIAELAKRFKENAEKNNIRINVVTDELNQLKRRVEAIEKGI